MANKVFDALAIQQELNKVEGKAEKSYVDENLSFINSSLEEKMNKTDLIESTQLAESTIDLMRGNLGYILATTDDSTIKAGSDAGTGFVADTTGKFLCTENTITKDDAKISLRTNKTNLRYLLVSYDSSNNATVGSWIAFESDKIVTLPTGCVKFRLTFSNSDASALDGDEYVAVVHGATFFQTEINDNSITYSKLNSNAVDKIIDTAMVNTYKNDSVKNTYSFPSNGVVYGMDISGTVVAPATTNASVVTSNKLSVKAKINIATNFNCSIIVYSYNDTGNIGYRNWVNYTDGDDIVYSAGATYVRITIGKRDGSQITSEDTIVVTETFSPSGLVTVDKNGNGNYTSVVKAVEGVAENIPIFIKPGDYYGTIEAFQKEIILIGTDRNKCRLISTNGLYAHPPMNGSCGYFENLTFYHQKTDNSADTSSVAGGYAVHVESDYSANKKMTFVNCEFISDFYPAFGSGLRPNFTLEFINCKFHTTAETMYSSLGSDGYLGAVYFHDSNTSYRGANQNIIFRNCEIIAKGKYALVPYSMNTNNEMTAYFVNTLLYSETNGKTNIIFHRVAPESGMWSGKCCKLDVKSYGNNISELNA